MQAVLGGFEYRKVRISRPGQAHDSPESLADETDDLYR